MNLRLIAIRLLEAVVTQQSLLEPLLLSALVNAKDRALLSEICFGVLRFYTSLEKMALQLEKRLQLNLFEKLALFVGLYQLHFLQKVPAFAAIFETIEAIKKKVPKAKVGFIHALLQKAKDQKFEIDEEDNFPQFFIKTIKKEYGTKSKTILNALMQKPKWFARKMGGIDTLEVEKKELEKMVLSHKFYIQNPMSIRLMECLQNDCKPKSILDLCAGKGGKLLLAHEFFPEAKLFAIEKNQKQIKVFQENFKKYELQASIQKQDALEMSEEKKFDLVIVDVPCSNSGVFAKHPEAKWRLSKKQLLQLHTLQKKLLKKAFALTNPGGQVWYMTCSILPQENEKVTNQFRANKQKIVLPTVQGVHGGYGCSFKKAK